MKRLEKMATRSTGEKARGFGRRDREDARGETGESDEGRGSEAKRERRRKEEDERGSESSDITMTMMEEIIDEMKEERKEMRRERMEYSRMLKEYKRREERWENRLEKMEECKRMRERELRRERERREEERGEGKRTTGRVEQRGGERETTETMEGKRKPVNEKEKGKRQCETETEEKAFKKTEDWSEETNEELEKMCWQKDKRRRNLTIKGLRIKREDNVKREICEWLRRELGVSVNLVMWERSGEAWIITVGDRREKEEIMRRKSLLKGGTVYIENDLTWEERRVRENMMRWAWKERRKGKKVKIGEGRVMVDGEWLQWEDIEWERQRSLGEDEKKEERGGRG